MKGFGKILREGKEERARSLMYCRDGFSVLCRVSDPIPDQPGSGSGPKKKGKEQGYILCKILWPGGGNGAGEKMKNKAVRNKMKKKEKGERKKKKRKRGRVIFLLI